MKIYISAHNRKPELLRINSLVFDTLRVGFPTAEIEIWGNGRDEALNLHWLEQAARVEGKFVLRDEQTYGERIQEWIDRMDEPFVICDTDIVFYDNMETVEWKGPLHGCHVPAFHCPFAKTRTVDRLHTHLLYFDPTQIRKSISRVRTVIPDNYLTPWADMILPARVPHRSGWQFYDIAAALYHTVGGYAFTPEIRDRYSHLNCGTISDLVGSSVGLDLTAAHQAIAENPELGRGIWRKQDEFFKQYAV